MASTTPDNIASESQEDAKLSADAYMQQFANVEAQGATFRTMVEMIDVQPDQDARLFMLIKCIKQQQKLNDEMYDLLVEMNNFYAPK